MGQRIGKAVTVYPLETEDGDYEAGKPCAYGLVRNVDGRTVFIAGWDGKPVVVVAVKGETNRLTEPVLASPARQPGGISGLLGAGNVGGVK
jgi:hypothetical protein